MATAYTLPLPYKGKYPKPSIDTTDNIKIPLSQNCSNVIGDEVLNIKTSTGHARHINLITRHSIGTYKMETKDNRGILFFVNQSEYVNEPRNGYRVDSYYMINLFQSLNFKIYYFENITSRDFRGYLQALLNSDELAKTECLVFTVLCHGRLNQLLLRDGEKEIEINDIINKFCSKTLKKSLEGTPKIFLFPSCRGTDIEVAVKIKNGTQFDCGGNSHWKDVMVCYGAAPGFKTMREMATGSWFIQQFCKILSLHCHEEDLDTMLARFQHGVMNLFTKEDKKDEIVHIQTPHIVEYDFNSLLYFHPGYNKE